MQKVRPVRMTEIPDFRTCEELDAAGVAYDPCTRSACVYAHQCQRRQDPLDPFNIATVLGASEVRQYGSHAEAVRSEMGQRGTDMSDKKNHLPGHYG